MAVTPSGTTALVADFQTGSLTPVALPSLVAGPALPVGANPTGVTIPPDGATAWVSAGDGVTPVSLATASGRHRPIAHRCPGTVHRLPTRRATRRGSCSGDRALVDVDAATGRVVRTVPLSGIPAAWW